MRNIEKLFYYTELSEKEIISEIEDKLKEFDDLEKQIKINEKSTYYDGNSFEEIKEIKIEGIELKSRYLKVYADIILLDEIKNITSSWGDSIFLIPLLFVIGVGISYRLGVSLNITLIFIIIIIVLIIIIDKQYHKKERQRLIINCIRFKSQEYEIIDEAKNHDIKGLSNSKDKLFCWGGINGIDTLEEERMLNDCSKLAKIRHNSNNA